MPLILKYNKQILLRLRLNENAIIESSIEKPYEIHLIESRSEKDFESFAQYDKHKQFLHLKEQLIRSALLIKGNKL